MMRSEMPGEVVLSVPLSEVETQKLWWSWKLCRARSNPLCELYDEGLEASPSQQTDEL